MDDDGADDGGGGAGAGAAAGAAAVVDAVYLHWVLYAVAVAGCVDGLLVVMVNYDHYVANVMSVAFQLDGDDDGVHDLVVPPSELVGCALQIVPLFFF